MLAVENVEFAYGGSSILNGLSLEIRDGEMLGVVGPNGSGKTTLMRLVGGTLTPSNGTIRVDGSDLKDLGPGRRARLVAVVPQNPVLPLGFTVLQLVMLGRNPHLKLLQWEGRHDIEVAEQAMRLTDTYRIAGRTLETLSGGERQRALVAMALAQEAPVLLLDEPTSSLDLAHQVKVMDLVRELHEQQGGAVLIAMHDLTLAAQYCNRLVMLSEGRSFAEGPPGDVLTRDNVSRVYGAEVQVLSHPQGGTPVVLPISNGTAGTVDRGGEGAG